MGKVSVNWTIDMDLAVAIEKKAKESGRKLSYIANSYLRRAIEEDKDKDFTYCPECNGRYAIKIGYCPHCADKKNRELLQKIDKTIEEKDQKKEGEKIVEDKKKKQEQLKELRIHLARRKKMLQEAEEIKDLESIKRYKQIIKEQEKKIKNLE